ncbi:hypothetical protein AC739_05790 [Planococcus glaciei]|nr:hypothetical protein AC739_05790 [Planococcus glaciei]
MKSCSAFFGFFYYVCRSLLTMCGFGSANLYYTVRLLLWGMACLFQRLFAAFQKIADFFSVFRQGGFLCITGT